MSNTNLRLFQVNTPIDVTTETDTYLNAGVNAYTGQFPTLSGNETSRAAVFDKNNLIMAPADKSLNFGTGYFLIAFWVKFADQSLAASDISIGLYFEDESIVMTDLPTLNWIESGYYVKKTMAKDSSAFYYRADQVPDFDSGTPTSLTPSGTLTNIDWTTPHYISIVRDNGVITFRCDGNIFAVATNSANFDLTSNSFLVMDAFGHEDTIGNVPIIDDLVLSNEDIKGISSTPPTDYITKYTVDPGNIPWVPSVMTNILKVY